MRIAVASGKGGTGKTTVSTNLAKVVARTHRVQYLDCDVEEPNGHLFLHPKFESHTPVEIPVPSINEEMYTNCGECSRLCQYNAIACLAKTTMVFPELCHGCGGCTRVCPVGAITEMGRQVGFVERGRAGSVEFVHGKLNIGEAMSPPVIRAVCDLLDDRAAVIMDAPPGTSCPLVASLQHADKVVLVAEPTAFGLHDLKIAVETVRAIGIPFGVFVNRADIGDERVLAYCKEQCIPVWGGLPHDRRIAEAYSCGRMAVDVVPEVSRHFESLAAILFGREGIC